MNAKEIALKHYNELIAAEAKQRAKDKEYANARMEVVNSEYEYFHDMFDAFEEVASVEIPLTEYKGFDCAEGIRITHKDGRTFFIHVYKHDDYGIGLATRINIETVATRFARWIRGYE